MMKWTAVHTSFQTALENSRFKATRLNDQTKTIVTIFRNCLQNINLRSSVTQVAVLYSPCLHKL